MIVYDFDGVMTNNKVIIDQHGTESVIVNRGDGYAIEQIKCLDIDQIILSTEKNSIVEKRANKLKIDVIHGVDNKAGVLSKICAQKGYITDNVMFIGNDLNDYDAMKMVGIKGCPADAQPEIKEICDWISDKNGGDGVIRGLYHMIFNYRK